MTFDMMSRLFPAAAVLAEQKGTPCQQLTGLLKEHRHAMVLLLTVFAGEDALQRPAAATAIDTARKLTEGGMLYLQEVRAASPERACMVLYRYRPADPEALFFLLKQQQKEDTSLHYFANSLRLLVLSKMEKNSKYPTLFDVLKNKPQEDTRTGMEIYNDILKKLKFIVKEEKENDNRKGT